MSLLFGAMQFDDNSIGNSIKQVVKMACDLMGSTIQQIDNVKFSDEQYAAAIVSFTRLSFISGEY